MLIPHGIQVEDRGGDVQAIPISALVGTNLDTLTEAIVLQAELMDLKGDPSGKVEGVVIESRTDPQRGYGQFTLLWLRCRKVNCPTQGGVEVNIPMQKKMFVKGNVPVVNTYSILVQVEVFWVVMCSVVVGYQCFRAYCCLCLSSPLKSQITHQDFSCKTGRS
jgi:hypothetical protein